MEININHTILILEFMGFEPAYIPVPMMIPPVPEGKAWTYLPQSGKRYKLVTDTLYNKSWDWLMPVVIKIEKEHCPVRIDGRTCAIAHIAYTVGPDKIETVYQAVVDFLLWLKQNPL